MFYRKDDISDKEKLEAASAGLRQGSAEAFKILYNIYADKVYRFCLRMLGDVAQAEDAFQETFFRIYDKRTEYNGENFGGWLFAIARNNCLNTLRQRRDALSFDESFGGYEQPKVYDLGLKQQIERAISALPIPLREALLLREYEDFSYQEIAETLGIELSLAKVRVHRARLLLRKILQPLMKEYNES